jgi:hypothetical protein
MVLEGKIAMREVEGNTLGFLMKATGEQLLTIANGTAIRSDPLVANFNNQNAPHFHQKEEDLRRKIIQGYKRHADFRGMVVLAAAQFQETAPVVKPPPQGSVNSGRKGK